MRWSKPRSSLTRTGERRPSALRAGERPPSALLALFASGIVWLVLLALVAAPIAGPLTLVYLAISSDTNGRAESHEACDERSYREPRASESMRTHHNHHRKEQVMRSRFITNVLALVAGG